MGLDGALGEAFYVLGQHLLLVAVGCIRLGFFQVLHHLLEDGCVVPPRHPEITALEFVALQFGSHFSVQTRFCAQHGSQAHLVVGFPILVDLLEEPCVVGTEIL